MLGRSNSVIESTAPITTRWQKGIESERGISELRQQLDSKKQELGNYYYLFVLMLSTGIRITEALNITQSDISASNQIYIKGLKGSQDRIVSGSEIAHFIVRSVRASISLFHGMNRFSGYRHLKRLDFGMRKKGRQLDSVTSLFREKYVKDLRTLQANKSTLSRNIGHKQESSTEYYGKD